MTIQLDVGIAARMIDAISWIALSQRMMSLLQNDSAIYRQPQGLLMTQIEVSKESFCRGYCRQAA